jgi:hypothetical protein
MDETKRESYSLLGRLMWLPLLTAPVSKTFPKVLAITAICTALSVLLGGRPAILKGILIGWIIGCWIASLTYRGT